MTDRCLQHYKTTQRGVSHTIGYVLLLTVILVSIITITTVGITLIERQQTTEYISNTEQAFSVFAHSIEAIERNGAPARATEMQFIDGQVQHNEDWILQVNVTTNGTTRTYVSTGTTISYEKNNRGVHYEMGSVIQTDRESGTIVRKPPYKFQQGQTILSTVATTATGTAPGFSGTQKIVFVTRESETRIQTITNNPTNITVTLTTPRYKQWETYFENQGLTQESINPSTNTIVYSYSTENLAMRETAVKIDINR